MNRALRVLLLLAWFEFGLILVLLPWMRFWEANYFLERFPLLIPVLLNPFLRGAVSGLGLLDAGMALGAFRRRFASLAARN